MAIKEINGIRREAMKKTNNVGAGQIKQVGAGEGQSILIRAMCWTTKYQSNSANGWLVTHTASGFNPANPLAQIDTNYAPTSSWAAFWQNGYDQGGMAAQTFGEDSQGNYWWGAVRNNDIGRCFMHATSSQVVDGNLDPNEAHGVWPNDVQGMGNPRRMHHVTFGSLDKVWIVGKNTTHNVESMNVSYYDPQQTNDQMQFLQIANLVGSDSNNIRACIPVYCGGRKYAALQGNSFFINTGTLSSSVADANQWIARTDPGITEPSGYMAYGNHPDHPDGVFVVLGAGNRQIKVSTDNGANWSNPTIGGGGTTQVMNGVCYDSRRKQFIAVGNNGTILTSSAMDVTKWAVAGGDSELNGDAGSAHYGVQSDGFNVVVTGLNEVKVSTGSLTVFEDVPYFTSQTSGKSVGSEGDIDSFFLWGATPGVIKVI